MRKNYRRLDRIYESHDVGSMQIPQEVLDMKVGDMLKRLELEDTPESSYYENVEDAIMSCVHCLTGNGYGSGVMSSNYSSIEDVDPTYATDPTLTTPDEMVSFEEMPDDLYGQERQGLDDFTF